MPPLFMTTPSAPIIIPITALVVVAVAVILLIFHLIRKLLRCPHHRKKFDPTKVTNKSVLPSSPYTIDPNSTASSSSIYFVKSKPSSPGSGNSDGTTATTALLMYPALAAASTVSRTPSPRHHSSPIDDTHSGNRVGGSRGDLDNDHEQTFSLDNVDSGDADESGLLLRRHGSPVVIHEVDGHSTFHAISTRSDDTSSPYHQMEERSTIRQEVSYHRSEREFITSNDYTGGGRTSATGSNNDGNGINDLVSAPTVEHYESDV